MGCDASRLKLKLIDMTSFASVREFVKQFENGIAHFFRMNFIEVFF
jgi:hypothetical protein